MPRIQSFLIRYRIKICEYFARDRALLVRTWPLLNCSTGQWHLREVATECQTWLISCRHRHVSNPPLDHMLFRSYPNWRRRWNVGLITCGCGVWRHTAKTINACSCAVELTQLTDKVAQRRWSVVAEVVVRRAQGRQVSVWWFDGLTFSLATWNRGRAEVCGLRHVCVWMQERWKVRARVCNCVHESWSTNTFFCNLHSEWDLLCTSNVDHSTFQTKDFVYIGAFFGHSSWLFATKVWLTHTWKNARKKPPSFLLRGVNQWSRRVFG